MFGIQVSPMVHVDLRRFFTLLTLLDYLNHCLSGEMQTNNVFRTNGTFLCQAVPNPVGFRLTGIFQT